jgi:hypothetical protein
MCNRFGCYGVRRSSFLSEFFQILYLCAIYKARARQSARINKETAKMANTKPIGPSPSAPQSQSRSERILRRCLECCTNDGILHILMHQLLYVRRLTVYRTRNNDCSTPCNSNMMRSRSVGNPLPRSTTVLLIVKK